MDTCYENKLEREMIFCCPSLHSSEEQSNPGSWIMHSATCRVVGETCLAVLNEELYYRN
jgi:hypothetical protein